MPRDEVVLQDILNAARLVMDFIQQYDKPAFLDDWKTAKTDIPDLLEKIEAFQ